MDHLLGAKAGFPDLKLSQSAAVVSIGWDCLRHRQAAQVPVRL